MLTLSLLDRPIYYFTGQGRASGWEMVSAFVRMHLDQKSIRLIVCKPSFIGSHFFQLLITKVWNLDLQK